MYDQLPIIDWQQHAQRDSDTINMSRELLTLFIQELPELEKNLEEAFNAQDGKALRTVLHRMQGACAYCGLPRLREITANADHLLRNSEKFISIDLQAILREIALVREELNKHGIQ